MIVACALIIAAGVITLALAARAGQLDQRPQEPQGYLGGRPRR